MSDTSTMPFSRRVFTVLAGIRADGDNLHRLPTRLFKARSGE